MPTGRHRRRRDSDSDSDSASSYDDRSERRSRRRKHRRKESHQRDFLSGCCCFGRRAKETIEEKGVAKGGIRPRKFPQDLHCCLLFVIFWIVLIGIAVFALATGNSQVVFLPTDYDSNICGFDIGRGNDNKYDLTFEEVLWYPMWIDPLDGELTQVVNILDKGWCVRECPNELMQVICHYDSRDLPDEEKLELAKIWAAGENRNATQGCAFSQFPTEIVGERCIPSLSNTINGTVGQVLPSLPALPELSVFEEIFYNVVLFFANVFADGLAELRKAAVPLVLVVGITLLLCAIAITMFRIVVGPAIYMSLLLIQFGFVLATLIPSAVGVYSLMRHYYGSEIMNDWFRNLLPEEGRSTTDFRTMQICFGVGGVFAILTFLYFCLMIFLWKRIRTAIAVVNESVRAVFQMADMILVPIVVFFCLLIVVAFFALIAVFLNSFSRTITIDTGAILNPPAQWIDSITGLDLSGFANETLNAQIVVEKGSFWLTAMQLYNLFGFFWTYAFIEAIGYTTVAGCVASWFFSRPGNKKKPPSFVTLRSLVRTVFFHSGSLLFGCLIVAVIQFARFIYRKLKSHLMRLTSGNTAALPLRILLKIIGCLMWILEILVKYFNKKTYIVIAIHGSNFCLSAQRAFRLMISNIGRVAAVNFISTFLIYLGIFMVTIGGGLFVAAFIYLHNLVYVNLLPSPYWITELTTLRLTFIPIILGVIISFAVAKIFFSVYGVTIDTILLCFLEDLDMHSLDEDNPYFMPSSLMKSVSRSEKRGKKRKKKKKKEKSQDSGWSSRRVGDSEREKYSRRRRHRDEESSRESQRQRRRKRGRKR